MKKITIIKLHILNTYFKYRVFDLPPFDCAVKTPSMCLFCWYWWNCCISLLKLSFHKYTSHVLERGHIKKWKISCALFIFFIWSERLVFLITSEQFFSYIMVNTSYISMLALYKINMLFNSASLLKQQPTSGYIDTLVHVILIPSQSIFALTFYCLHT